MKKLLCLLGGAMCIANGFTQLADIKPLQIGDTLPNITFNNIINYKSTSAKLSDFNNKPIIIDFFATWCSGCIEALPHLDSLQRRFGDRIQILVVSREPIAKINAFLGQYQIGRDLILTFIAQDTILPKYFPHRLIPHEVIINSNVVKAITYPEFIEQDHLRSLLSTGEIDLPLKQDLTEFDRKKPLFKNDIGNALDIALNQFLLTKSIGGISGMGGTIFSADSLRKRIYYFNAPMLQIYLRAANITNNYNRVILEVGDKSKYIQPSENSVEWMKNNYYSIEVIVPGQWTSRMVNSWILQELNLCQDVKVSVQQRDVQCWVLKKGNNRKVDPPLSNDQLNQTIKLRSGVMSPKKDYKFKSIKDLINVLNNQTVGSPLVPIVIDETGDNSTLDIHLSTSNIQNLSTTAIALKKYGLKLVPAVRKLEMLVVQDKTSSAQIKDK